MTCGGVGTLINASGTKDQINQALEAVLTAKVVVTAEVTATAAGAAAILAVTAAVVISLVVSISGWQYFYRIAHFLKRSVSRYGHTTLFWLQENWAYSVDMAETHFGMMDC